MNYITFFFLPISIILYLVVLNRSKKLGVVFLALAITYYLNIWTFGNIKIYLFDTGYIGLLIYSLLNIVKRKQVFHSKDAIKTKALMYFYLFWILFSTIVAFYIINDLDTSISNLISLIRYIQICSIFLLVVNLQLNYKEIKFVLKYIYLNALVIAIYGIFQMYINNGQNFGEVNWWGRTYSVFNSTGPNSFAVYILFFIIVSLIFALDNKLDVRVRAMNFVVFIIMLIPFIFTISRTGYVTFLFIIPFLVNKKNKKYFVLLPVLLMILFLSDNIIYQRLIAFTFTENGLDSSSIGRYEYWKAALSVIARYPVSGVGFNGFANVGLRYSNYFEVLINPHNEYLQLLVNSGVVGIILFIIIIRNLWKNSKALIRSANDSFFKNALYAYNYSILVLAISGFFFSPFSTFQVTGQFWLISGLIGGVNYVKKID
jgi:O-antigen ligase